ncbi:MAG: SIS domain-containing protein [Bacteroidales bacterium]|nr:SIS domain-containing protein [Bacteroidales bacterium]
MNNYYTYKEIQQQPQLWSSILDLVQEKEFEIKSLLAKYQSLPNSEVIFTGAGSSFFIGEMVSGFFQLHTGISSRAVSSTEIVTHPEMFFNPKKEVLLISFARSGDSPESIAAINNAEKVSSKVSNLIICCNKDGELMKRHSPKDVKILLPELANDKGLAMTSSVSSMALTALLIGRIDELKNLKHQLELAGRLAKRVIKEGESIFDRVIKTNYERVVFLGSGSFLGLAREAHLKLQELTNGKYICKFDSFLGFRHGPKAVVNEKTLMFYLFSNNKYVRQYELDMVNSMNNGIKPAYSIGISQDSITSGSLDQLLTLSENEEFLEESFLMLPELVAVQVFSFLKSVHEGFNPDSPSINGTIHRVVQGVKIYPLP